MPINQNAVQGNLNAVNSRLHASMTDREKLYDKAFSEFSRIRTAFQKTDKMDEDALNYTNSLEDFLYGALNSDSSSIKILKDELIFLEKEIRRTTENPVEEYLLKLVKIVATVILNPKAAKPKELFKNTKRAVRDDLLGSIFGDKIGGIIGEKLDAKKQKKDSLKEFKQSILIERRNRLANMLDNAKLAKSESDSPKETRARRNIVAPPPIIANQQVAANNPAPSPIVSAPLAEPPPIVLGENQRISKSGKNIMTKTINEDGTVKWTRKKIPQNKQQNSEKDDYSRRQDALKHENDEEMMDIIKEQTQLLEKIEENTRGLSKNLEKTTNYKDGGKGIGTTLTETIEKTLPSVVARMAPSMTGMLKSVFTGAKGAIVTAVVASAVDSIVDATNKKLVGEQAKKNPENVTISDQATTGVGSMVGNLSPVGAAIAGGKNNTEQSIKNVGAHILGVLMPTLLPLTTAYNVMNRKASKDAAGTGLHDIKRDAEPIYDTVVKGGMNPILAGIGATGIATVGMKNVDKAVKTIDKVIDLHLKPFKDLEMAPVIEKTKDIIPNAVDIVGGIPKQVFGGLTSTKANPTTPMEKLGTMIPNKYKPIIDKTLTAMNPSQAVRRGVQKMVGFRDDQKENIQLIIGELLKRGMNPGQITAILGNVDKESKFKSQEENLNYSNTNNDHIRTVFGKERFGAMSDSQIDELKKDKVKFTEYIYGNKFSTGKKLGNTEPGDGWKYRGRGFIQLTGKSNYDAASKAIFGDDRLVKNPDLAVEPSIAAQITAWYAETRGKNMADKMKLDIMKASQEELNRLYTSAIAGHKIDTSDPRSYDSILMNRVNQATQNPVLAEMVEKSGAKLAQGSASMVRPVIPQTPAPIIIDNSKTSISGGGGGGGNSSAGIPNVRNEESSFRRSTGKTSR